MVKATRSYNLAKYESKNPLKKFLLRKFLENIKEIVTQTSASSLLDIGCGEGIVLKMLMENNNFAEVVGVDVSKGALKIAKADIPEANFRQMSAEKLDFPDKKFDLVIMLEVLEHLKKPEIALEEAKRVSTKYCLFSAPDEPLFSILSLISGRYLRRGGKHPEHVNYWSHTEFLDFVSREFKIEQSLRSTPWTIILAKK